MNDTQFPDPTSSTAGRGDPAPPRLRPLIVLGLCSLGIYVAIAWLSQRFLYDSRPEQRPIFEVVALFWGAFVFYLIALRIAIQASRIENVTAVIVLFAAGFRAILLASDPIQEVDIYRYLWDGQAAIAGVSPFRYAPRQVLESCTDDLLPGNLARLIAKRDSSEAVRTILSRVHFSELPTVYPPVSQFFFAAAALTTPETADVSARIVIMKAWLLAFDLGTLWVLISLLQRLRLPVGWALAYGWCPLVMKEFANSGHLDSIAIFLTMLALSCTVKAKCTNAADGTGALRSGFGWWVLSAAFLALAVGAKLYPIVLAPLIILSAARGVGAFRSLITATVFLLLVGLVLMPMVGKPVGPPLTDAKEHTSFDMPDEPEDDTQSTEPSEPTAGLMAFLSHWEMNDFVFLLLVENLKPEAQTQSSQRPWFAIVPDDWRKSVVDKVSASLNLSPKNVPFSLARVITAIMFITLAMWWAWRGSGAVDGQLLLECAFLTIAWFWLLAPTQNPWYWCWAVPLLPFARGRTWLAMSGLVLTYYLRFWLAAHWPEIPVAPTRYYGASLFDFGVVWGEYAPWFAWLFVEWWIRRRGVSRHCTDRHATPNSVAE